MFDIGVCVGLCLTGFGSFGADTIMLKTNGQWNWDGESQC